MASPMTIQECRACAAAFDGQKVAIRGFLYQTTDGRLFLASTPNLKSCCVGSLERTLDQLEVIGLKGSQPTTRAVTIQGKLTHDGEPLVERWQLQQASLLSDPTSISCPLCWLSLLLLGGCLVKLAIYWRSTEQSRTSPRS